MPKRKITKKLGRRRLPGFERKAQFIHLRVTEDTKAEMVLIAKNLGLSLTDYLCFCHESVLEEAKKEAV